MLPPYGEGEGDLSALTAQGEGGLAGILAKETGQQMERRPAVIGRACCNGRGRKDLLQTTRLSMANTTGRQSLLGSSSRSPVRDHPRQLSNYSGFQEERAIRYRHELSRCAKFSATLIARS
jgi:hypothetical protein